MKRHFFLILLVIITINISVAQSPSSNSPKSDEHNKTPQTTAKESNSNFQLGNKTVVIPPPGGFEEALSQSEFVKRHFSGTNAADLDLLAVHVPKEVLDKLRVGIKEELPFYTHVTIPKQFREVDFSATDFSAIISYVQSDSGKVFDLSSPEMKSLRDARNKNLTELLEREAKIDFSKPVNLGEIVKTPTIYATLLLIKTKLQVGGLQRDLVFVNGMGIVRVKQRVIFAHTFKIFKSEEDFAMVKEFSKKWLDEIVKAN
ncbi:MAG TPA: hypothetical protein VGW12_20300 [Pyrinomonadaceae bacterium]|nr:hypothetical protein [Pyrinomonadaceae bacterium]